MTEINRGLLNHSGNHKNNKEKVMTELENEINRKKIYFRKKIKINDGFNDRDNQRFLNDRDIRFKMTRKVMT